MSMVDEQSDGSEESPSSKRPTSPEKRTVNVPVKRSPKKVRLHFNFIQNGFHFNPKASLDNHVPPRGVK